MIRSIVLYTAACLTAALCNGVASAQCFETDFGTLCPNGALPAGYGDDVLFDLQPLGFAFPMGGVAPSYTHAHIQSNGVIFLTNGVLSGETTLGFSTNQAVQIANLRGAPGSPPRIAPFWRDIVIDPVNGGGVYYNADVPGRFVVTWAGAVQYSTTSPVFTLQAQLFSDGRVTFYYNGATASGLPVITGVSAGNNIASAPGVDLSAGGNSSSTLWMHERFASGAFDLQSVCIGFTPSGGGFSQQVGQPASHTSYGDGCYQIAAETFYQSFGNAAAAAAGLTGQSIVFTPTPNGYTATWGGASYITPGGAAAVLGVGDDGAVTVTPSIPFPSPFGAAAALGVHGNAIVSLGATPQDFPGAPNVYTPTAATLRNASQTAFWAWHDYNAAEPGSGPVTYDEAVVGADTVALVTWDDVENYSQPTTINRSTLQFQLNLTTGVAAIVWVAVDSNGTSQYGSAHLVGFSPGGPSLDPGPIVLATALPITTQPDLAAMTLSAAPNPVSTATTGTLITYTTANIPEAAPFSGVYLGANILSLGGVPAPGVELGFIGAPGCRAFVLTIDNMIAMVGPTPTLAVAFPLPAGVPSGFQFYSQSIALVVPNSLPNGQNAFGLTTSNGIRSFVTAF